MNISVETDIGQRKKRQVVFTGTILPPTQSKHNSMEHCCEGTAHLPRARCNRGAQSLRPAKYRLYALPFRVYHCAWVRVCTHCNVTFNVCTAEHGDGMDGRPNLTVGTVLRAWQADDMSVRCVKLLVT